MKTRFFGFLLSAAFFVGCGTTPVSIAGRVVDHRGSPVARAEVSTDPDTDVVVTNSRGFFQLRHRINENGETEAIPSGSYRIKVKMFGFKDLEFETNVDEGAAKVDDLVLQPLTPDIGDASPEQLEERPTDPDDGSIPANGI